jgi:hypothetical protein
MTGEASCSLVVGRVFNGFGRGRRGCTEHPRLVVDSGRGSLTAYLNGRVLNR